MEIYKCAVKIYKCAVKIDCAVTVVGHRTNDPNFALTSGKSLSIRN